MTSTFSPMPDWLRLGRTPVPPARSARTIRVGGQELALKVRRLKTARRMTLRLAPDGSEARVTLPPWGRLGDAERFARDRADWLAQQLATVRPPEPPGIGGSLPYRGRSLAIDWCPVAPRTPSLVGDREDRIVLGGPEDTVVARLRRWLEREALHLCALDLADYCARAGVPTPPLRLSRAARRWGSCATDGTIRINWRLVMAPDAVRRSVVAHEVAHLAHFDHSPEFHRHLRSLFDGDLAAANRWLKHEGRGLYLVFG
jgi:predicted metal-dependent hydrolase